MTIGPSVCSGENNGYQRQAHLHDWLLREGSQLMTGDLQDVVCVKRRRQLISLGTVR